MIKILSMTSQWQSTNRTGKIIPNPSLLQLNLWYVSRVARMLVNRLRIDRIEDHLQLILNCLDIRP